MKATRFLIMLVLVPLIVCLFASRGLAQTSTFTYQGRLTDGGTPANGIYDLQFGLFDNAAGGGQIGSIQTVSGVSVSSGIFSVSIDFGSVAFTGASRFLEISARLAGGGSFTLLTPRQQITSTPYAVRSLGTSVADGLSSGCAGCVQDANINAVAGSKVSGAIPVASVPAGSTSYIQNTNSPQPGSNFNISGSGTVGMLTAAGHINTSTQYNIGGNRVLSVMGTDNTFAGINAGQANTTGDRNSFFGRGAGLANTTSGKNSFFGYQAGNQNRGDENAFFGSAAGPNNTTGQFNSFFGASAGARNSTGRDNTLVGYRAGEMNTSGSNNTIIGSLANVSQGNIVDHTGHDNTFVGYLAGEASISGSNNTMIGSQTNHPPNAILDYATAIGAGAFVGASNTIALGRSDGSDTVLVYGRLQIDTLATAGSTQLCLNGSNRVGTCSSSLRYKTSLAPYRSGLSVINQLRPISFIWQDSRKSDLGFGAEDVEKVDPLLVIYNANGQVEGVKYDRINVVLVNAIKEQQIAIKGQQNEIEMLRTANAAFNARLTAMERAVRGVGVRGRGAKRSTK